MFIAVGIHQVQLDEEFPETLLVSNSVTAFTDWIQAQWDIMGSTLGAEAPLF